jgi:hypothetical protein
LHHLHAFNFLTLPHVYFFPMLSGVCTPIDILHTCHFRALTPDENCSLFLEPFRFLSTLTDAYKSLYVFYLLLYFSFCIFYISPLLGSIRMLTAFLKETFVSSEAFRSIYAPSCTFWYLPSYVTFMRNCLAVCFGITKVTSGRESKK